MIDNWLKSWEDLYTYKHWKKEVTKWNKKVLQFWSDAFEDIFKKDKKED